MKKVFLSLITILYIAVSSGFPMEIHFCMGQRTTTGDDMNSGKACGLCGMKEKNGGCCSDEKKFVKLSDDHKHAASHVYNPDISELPNLTHHVQISGLISLPKYSSLVQSFANSGPPIYVANRVFRI